MLAAGADTAAAIEVANVAGGLEVERLGVVPLTAPRDPRRAGATARPPGQKILPLDQLMPTLQRLRLAGKRIVMTNGCFDLLHPGHVASLQEARKQGDCLLVAVNSDRSVREIKGPGRPGHRPAGPGRDAGRAGLRRLRRDLRRRERGRAGRARCGPTCWSRPTSTRPSKSWATSRCCAAAATSSPCPRSLIIRRPI